MFESAFSVLLVVSKALCVVALVLFVVGLDLSKRWRLRHIPGPPALPFLGNLPQIIRMGSPAFFRQCRAKYGPVFKIAFGRSWSVVVAEPELLRQVGTKMLNHIIFRSLVRGEFAKLDDWGLVSAKDDYWRLVRTAWQPAFSAASLGGYLPRMVTCARQLSERLEAKAAAAEQATDGKAERVDIWRELGSMTLQVVGSTAYGVDFHAIDHATPVAQPAPGAELAAEEVRAQQHTPPPPQSGQYGSGLLEACQDVFRYSSLLYGSKYSRVALLLQELRPLVSAVAYALPDKPFRKLLAARSKLRDACISLIDGWKAGEADHDKPRAHTDGHASLDAGSADGGAPGKGGESRESNPSVSEVLAVAASDPATPKTPQAPAVAVGSFLGLMLAARNKATGEALTDLQVVAQVQTFILAGYETTANGLAFAVFCIANHPEVEARLMEEIDSVLGPNREPTEDDLSRLSYTEAVFHEALRLYPPAHATNRIDKAPFQVGGYTVPPDTPVFMSIFSSHHNPDVWPRAAEFIPERFLPGSPQYTDVCARVPNAFSPFGYGSRMCVGWKFAMMEAKVTLARLYQRLRFELEPGQVPLKTTVGITLSPKYGVWVRPVRRYPQAR